METLDLGQARDLCEREHYAAGCSHTAVFRHGLFRREGWPFFPLGAALWLPPTNKAAQRTLEDLGVDGDWRRVLALSRLVIEDGEPTNAASYLIGRSIRLIRKTGDWDYLVTYADQRMGHTGGIYKATNWRYLGEIPAGRAYYIGDRMTSRKAGTVTRSHDAMLALGAVATEAFPKHKFGMVLR